MTFAKAKVGNGEDVPAAPRRTMLNIADIKVGNRFRKELGDIGPLKSSIRQHGLFHPVVVDEDYNLIAGWRRMKAYEQLGWPTIPVRIISLKDIAMGEYVENTFRKDFTPSEAVAIARALGIGVRQRAKKRQGSGKLPEAEKGQTRDILAKAVGISGRTLEKAEAVVEAAEKDPALQPLVEEMDRTKKVEPIYKKVRANVGSGGSRIKPLGQRDRRKVKLWKILAEIKKLREAWPAVETLIAGFTTNELDRLVTLLTDEVSYLERALNEARARKPDLEKTAKK